MATSDDERRGLRRGAVRAVEILRDAGHEAVWAGGCVRDALLGRAPKDYDIATDAVPEQVMALFPRALPLGVAFGVVQVPVLGHRYEIATYRADLAYQDGRRPTGVRWASAREDVDRRDFTINGLLYDPLSDEVIDFVGGRSDLAAGRVRAIGDPRERFAEDHLRVLRAIRFAARFGFEIDHDTWAAAVEMAPKVAHVSAERVRDELTRALSEAGPVEALRLLERAGLTAIVAPELAGAEAAARDRFAALGRAAEDEVLAWALACADAWADPRAGADAMGRRLRFSRAMARDVGETIAVARGFAAWPSHGVAARKRLARTASAARALIVARAAAAAGQADPDAVEAAAADVASWGPEALRPPALLDGHDLRRAGHRPGPTFKDALAAIEDAQLEGRVDDEAGAWAIARDVLGPPGADA